MEESEHFAAGAAASESAAETADVETADAPPETAAHEPHPDPASIESAPLMPQGRGGSFSERSGYSKGVWVVVLIALGLLGRFGLNHRVWGWAMHDHNPAHFNQWISYARYDRECGYWTFATNQQLSVLKGRAWDAQQSGAPYDWRQFCPPSAETAR